MIPFVAPALWFFRTLIFRGGGQVQRDPQQRPFAIGRAKSQFRRLLFGLAYQTGASGGSDSQECLLCRVSKPKHLRRVADLRPEVA